MKREYEIVEKERKQMNGMFKDAKARCEILQVKNLIICVSLEAIQEQQMPDELLGCS